MGLLDDLFEPQQQAGGLLDDLIGGPIFPSPGPGWVRVGPWWINRETKERRPAEPIPGPTGEGIEEPHPLATLGEAVKQSFAVSPSRIGQSFQAGLSSAKEALTAPSRVAVQATDRFVQDPLGSLLGRDDDYRPSEAMRVPTQETERFRREAAEARPEGEAPSTLAGFAEAGAESAPLTGALMAQAALASPASSVATLGAIGGADVAERSMEEGQGILRAGVQGGLVGAGEALLERLGFKAAMKGLSKMPPGQRANMSKRLLETFIAEPSTEMVQELNQMAGEVAAGRDVDEVADEAAERITMAGGAALTLAGPMAAAGSLAPGDTGGGRPRPPESRDSLRLRVARQLAPEVFEERDVNRRQARVDSDTGLPNKRAFNEARDRINADEELAVLSIDADGLKSLNDEMGGGFALGDEMVIRPLANAIKVVAEKYSSPEMAFRMGGDDFFMAVPKDVAEDARIDLEEYTAPSYVRIPEGNPNAGKFVKVGATIGVGDTHLDAELSAKKSKKKKTDRGKVFSIAPPSKRKPLPETPDPQHAVPFRADNLTEGSKLKNKILQRIPTASQLGDKSKFWLTVRMGLGSIFDIREGSNAAIETHKQEAAFLASDLLRLRKGYIKENPHVDLDFLDEQIYNDLNAEGGYKEDGSRAIQFAPDEFQPLIDSMRSKVDSMTQELIHSGLLTPDQIETFEGNLGKYLTRSYAKHLDPNHLQRVQDTPIWRDADAFLREQHPDMTNDQRFNALKELATFSPDTFNFESGKFLGTEDIGILKQRRDIPAPLRALMGEITDPVMAFTKTIERSSRLLERYKMFRDIREAGLGTLFFEPNVKDPEGETVPNPNIPRGVTKELPGKDTRNPLGGLKVSDPLYRSMEESFYKSHRQGAWLLANGWIKMGFTIGSPQTQFRNPEANILNLVASGNLEAINPVGLILRGPGKSFADEGFSKALRGQTGRLAEGFKASATGLWNLTSQDMRDVYLDATRRGIVGKNTTVGDLELYFKGLADRMSNSDSRVVQGTLKGGRFLKKTYQLGDDPFKLAMYHGELRKLQWQAEEGLTPAGNDGSNIEALKDEAAENVKNMAQNYERLPKIIQELRRSSLGPFVSFPAASLRNLWQIADKSWDEIRSDNPRTRMVGAHRAGGLAAALAVPAVSAAALRKAAELAFRGDDDDKAAISKEEIGAIRDFLPFYAENSELIGLKREGSTYYIVDASFMDYFATAKKPLMAALRSGKIDENAALNSMLELARDFVAPEILQEVAAETLVGQTRSGRRIYHKRDPIGEKIVKGFAHVLEQSMPGGFKSARKLGEAMREEMPPWAVERTLGTEALSVMGPRVMPVNIPQAVHYNGGNFNAGKRSVASDITVVFREGRVSPEEIRETVASSSEDILREYKYLQRTIESAEKLNMERADIVQRLRDAKVPLKDIERVLRGGPELATKLWMAEMVPSVNKRLRREMKKDISANPENAEEIRRRYGL